MAGGQDDDWESNLDRDVLRGVSGKTGGIVNSAWLNPADLEGPKWSYRDATSKAVSGLVLGYRNDRGIGSIDDRHVLTVVGTRGGKGVSLIVPNLLTYDGSVIAVDPKGELAAITARTRRAKGQKVVVLDPFGTSNTGTTDSFNPLDMLDPKSDTVIDDAGLIADALIVGSEREPHFTDTARILVKNSILYTSTLPKEDRNLVTVYRLLSGADKRIQDIAERSEGRVRGSAALFALLATCGEAFDGVVAGMAENFSQMADRELSGVLSTARTQLEFLGSKSMASVLQSGNFSLSDLKTSKATLYLCLPAMNMGTHARWLRVILNLALVAFERARAKTDIPVLMVLDEFPVLGNMKAIETAAGLMAGFGVKLWIVVQDMGQLSRLYKESWETFIGNAGVMTFYSNLDKKTLDYLSDKLGQTAVLVEQNNDTTLSQRHAGGTGRREELRVQRLAAPNELEKLLNRDTRRVLVIAAGQSPVILKRMLYYADKPFDGLFDTWGE
jgi:type IV secretion system protein VirD4